jgi:putative DNA primase/helicase
VTEYHPAQAADGPPAPRELTPEEKAAHRQKMTALARWLWSETVPIGGTLAEIYLCSRLLLMRPPASLRLHYALRLDEIGKLPAMLGKVEHIEHGFVAVHVTYLHPSYDGGAPRRGARKTFGPTGGGAVRFGWPKPNRWLVIGEGIETTLSLIMATKRPGWAALSARGIIGLQLPPAARQVLIGADRDHDGRKAARIAQERWLAEGRRVRVITPPTPGTDWNDVLIGRAPAAMGDSNAA